MEEAAQEVDNPNDNKYNVSIRRLRKETKKVISSALKHLMVLPTDEGLPRDWQGLAELVAIPGERITQLQHEQNEEDPTLKVLNLWVEKSPDDSTIKNLFKHLERLDRFDIVDDVQELVDNDIKIASEESQDVCVTNNCCNDDILTLDDYDSISSGNGPQKYDAFVLFAKEDMNFATKLIDIMEKEYNLKFCTKDRDLVGGNFSHDIIIKLIEERCARVLVIFSKHFFESPYNNFLASFAQRLGIDQNSRIVIPLVYEECKIPYIWRFYSKLDYKRYKENSDIGFFWKRLYMSVKVLPADAKKTISCEPEEVEAKENTLKVEGKKKEGVVTFSKSLTDVSKDPVVEKPVEVTPSTSSNSLNILSKDDKKHKKKLWFPFTKDSHENGVKQKKPKKKSFFSRSKNAVAIPS